MGDPSKFSSLTDYYLFTICMGLLLLSEAVIWLFTSVGSGRKTKEKRADKGTLWLILLGFFGSIWVSFYCRSQMFPAPFRNLLLPHLFFYIGLSLIVAGMLVREFSVWTLKRAFTLSVQTTDGQHLIQKGFYRHVRNPAYAGSILSLLGIAFSLRNAIAPFAVLILCLLCYGIRIQVEEKALRTQFGQEFDEYCKHTYRIFPFVW